MSSIKKKKRLKLNICKRCRLLAAKKWRKKCLGAKMMISVLLLQRKVRSRSKRNNRENQALLPGTKRTTMQNMGAEA